MVEHITSYGNTTDPPHAKGPAALLGAVGLLGLIALRLAPSEDDRFAALVYPPWVPAHEILGDAAAIGVPLYDLGWNGRLVWLALDDAAPATRQIMNTWKIGRAFRIAASAPPACAPLREPNQ